MSRQDAERRQEWAIVGAILSVGLVCRLILAFARVDLVWPDEQFQTLEPAGKIVFGHAFYSWEWLKGFRTWLLPLFFVPPLAVAKALGIESGLSLLHLSRAYIAVLDSMTWALFYITLRRLELGALARILILAFVTLAPSSLLWGVTTLQDHVAMMLLILAFAWTTQNGVSISQLRLPVLGGFLLGIPGWYKLQSGFFAAGFVLTQIFLALRAHDERPLILRKTAQVLFGGLLALLCIGISDWITWGKFAESITNQITKGESISRFYGVSPWTDGIAKVLELVDPIFWFTFALSATGLLFERNRPRLSSPWIASAGMGLLFFLVFHFLIPHKEVRFFLPMLPFFLLFWGITWDTPLRKLEQSLQAKARRLPELFLRLSGFFTAAVLIGIYAGWGLTTALGRPLYLTSVDSAELEDQISQMKDSIIDSGQVCITLAGHNWSWTRGALIVGAPVRYEEIRPEEFVSKTIPPECHVALVSRDHSQSFQSSYSDFSFIMKGKNRFDLWARAPQVKKE